MLLPKLSKKEQYILIQLYRFRFVTIPHLKILLHHKNHQRIAKWLGQLLKLNSIGRHYKRTIKGKPAIFYLKPIGRLILKKECGYRKEKMNWVYDDASRSQGFMDRKLFSIDIYTKFLAFSSIAKIHILTSVEMLDSSFILHPQPDVYIAIEEHGTVQKRYFIEVFQDDIPRFALRERISKYITYAESQQWQKHTRHPFPIILFVCVDEKVKEYLLSYIKEKRVDEYNEIVMLFSTREKIKKFGIKSSVWQSIAKN